MMSEVICGRVVTEVPGDCGRNPRHWPGLSCITDQPDERPDG